jgi:hypothetical protein
MPGTARRPVVIVTGGLDIGPRRPTIMTHSRDNGTPTVMIVSGGYRGRSGAAIDKPGQTASHHPGHSSRRTWPIGQTQARPGEFAGL